MHVAAAHLKHVSDLADSLDISSIEYLRDDPQTGLVTNLLEDRQGIGSQPLKCIRRSPRLVGPAPEQIGTSGPDSLGDSQGSLLFLDGARTSDDRQLSHAHHMVSNLDRRAILRLVGSPVHRRLAQHHHLGNSGPTVDGKSLKGGDFTS